MLTHWLSRALQAKGPGQWISLRANVTQVNGSLLVCGYERKEALKYVSYHLDYATESTVSLAVEVRYLSSDVLFIGIIFDAFVRRLAIWMSMYDSQSLFLLLTFLLFIYLLVEGYGRSSRDQCLYLYSVALAFVGSDEINLSSLCGWGVLHVAGSSRWRIHTHNTHE